MTGQSRTDRAALSITVLVALLHAAMGISSQAYAAPESVQTALPVSKGDFVFREQFLYRKARDRASPAARDLDVVGGISALGYGATRNLALFGVVPYLNKRLELTDASGRRIVRRTRGMGDLLLFARHTILQRDRPGRTLRVAPVLGLELPTGDDDDGDRFGRLPATLQAGSGSWDPFGGLVVTYQTLDYQLDAQLSYKANTAANGFRFGDESGFDVSLQYRLWPRELGGGVPGFLYGIIETNLQHQAKNEADGISVPGSGGTALFVSPGLQYVTRRWMLGAVVQVPLVRDRNGAALDDDVIVRAGVRVNF